MSSDGNRPDIPRQRSDNTSWGQSFEDASQVDHDALPPLPASGNEEVFALGAPASEEDMNDWNDEGNQTGQFASRSSLFDFLREPSRYVPIIVVPLLFAVFTSLLVFLSINLHRPYISAAGFLPTIIVIIAVAVAQGAVVSFCYSDSDSDTDNGLWTLATVGGFALFFVIGIFALLGPVAALIAFCLFVVLFAIIMRLYFHPVGEGYVDVIYAFGKYSRTLYAGPNILLPWEKPGPVLNVGEKQWVCPLQKVQLSPDEDVVLRATISYQLMPKDAHIAAQVNQWEDMLREEVVSKVQSIATTFTPDDLIPLPQGLHSRPLRHNNVGDGELLWERVNKYLQDLVGDRAALWGVMVNWIHIRDVSLAPHGATIVETDAIFDIPTTILEKPLPPAGATPKRPAAKAPGSQPKVQKPNVTAGNARLAEETTQVVPAPPLQSAQEGAPEPTAPGIPDEKVLIEAYKAVQDGKITDSSTIRNIAAKFDLIAQDPSARDTVSFDAERAAQILYQQAQQNDPLFTIDEPKPDRALHQPNDGNLMAGG